MDIIFILFYFLIAAAKKAISICINIIGTIIGLPFYLVSVFRTSETPVKQICRDAWSHFPVVVILSGACAIILCILVAQTARDCFYETHPDSKIEALYTSIEDGCYAFSERLFCTAERQERWRAEHPGLYSFIDTIFWSETRERRLAHRHEHNLKLIEEHDRRRENRLSRETSQNLIITHN